MARKRTNRRKDRRVFGITLTKRHKKNFTTNARGGVCF